MSEEDHTRTTAQGPRHGRYSDARHRPTALRQTRTALRRLARDRKRRRWAVEGITVLACLVALVSYLSSGSGPAPGEPVDDGVPAGVRRPSIIPGAQDPRDSQASPGLRPRQRPASPSPTPTTPPPAPPPLTLTLGEVPAGVDLTVVGARDWMHFGLRGGDSTVRKRLGSGEIRDEGGRGRRGAWDGNQEIFRWRDGVPVTSADGTSHGVYICGADKGFALAVAGNGQLRTVHVYAGIWMARGRFEARLSSGGPTHILRLEDPHTSRSADFTVRFHAPDGVRLVMTWTAERTFTDDCAGVNLQAVALQ
ncbi:hypothetical protein QTQ03_24895 [Micromonospora sp. WMMA1363]|uniref:hypothetical protein n=1 Tax=Micromonospora sp. WMMA1363 TaxID=3053985 RepID=UPI00259CAA30|nr:hypothetical protein [Micromonospora sp. WMMA1363]MDM4722675.1 hypothetical protein [Micromonospora sp. WMMA1363]